MKRELARKAIHVSSTAVPLLVWLLPRDVAIALLVPVAALALAIDLARHRIRPFRYHFLRHTRTMLRPHERRGLAGATWMAIAYAVAMVIFPKPVAVAAMLFNGLGDAAAALAGKRWGRHRMAWGKSWEGFAAGLAVDPGAGRGTARRGGARRGGGGGGRVRPAAAGRQRARDAGGRGGDHARIKPAVADNPPGSCRLTAGRCWMQDCRALHQLFPAAVLPASVPGPVPLDLHLQ
jgi:hypothetical protein